MNHLPQVLPENISVWNLGIDLFLIALSLSVTVIMVTHSKAFHVGFFYGDNSIHYPYKSSTISLASLLVVGITIPVITITVLEVWLLRGEAARRQKALVAGRAVPAWVLRWLRAVLLFGYGIGCTELLVNVAKFTMGRLRPHFLAVCQPDVLRNATRLDPLAYISDYECTGDNKFALFQIRFSFPSGHSSLAFYAAVFIVMYLENRIWWSDRTMVVKTFFELLVLGMAWYTALSRVSDYKHHWEDVLAGSLIGTSGACFWVRRVLRVTKEGGPNGIM